MNLPSRNPADADVILLGNSHAQMYEPVWASILASRGQTGLLVPVNGCLPTVQANVNRECIEIAARNLSEIANLARSHRDHRVELVACRRRLGRSKRPNGR